MHCHAAPALASRSLQSPAFLKHCPSVSIPENRVQLGCYLLRPSCFQQPQVLQHMQLMYLCHKPCSTHMCGGTSLDGRSAILSSVATLTMCIDTPSFAACVHCSWTSCAWSMTLALPLRITAYTQPHAQNNATDTEHQA